MDFADLTVLARDVHDCRRCPLGFSRTHAVPGVGPSTARIMVVGEAPGQNEDQQGEPFVGAAGKLLDQLLRGIGLSRGDVFITNILKCRPPNNRDPQPTEVQACSPYLEQQLKLIKPEVVVLLGRHALARLLPGQDSITRMHGRVISKDGVSYIPVYHPAAALYNSFLQGPLEQDFKAVKAHLDRMEERRRAVAPVAAPVAKPEEQLTLFG
ncbi:MAG: uracil-DNA glycosylase [Candidatus Dormibacter sp.]